MPTSESATEVECDGSLAKAGEAGYSVALIRDYVGELTDRSLQRKLRDTSRNRRFDRVFASDDEPDTVSVKATMWCFSSPGQLPMTCRQRSTGLPNGTENA